jgi:hypothetical protein
MLLSTCGVLAGASGGAVVDLSAPPSAAAGSPVVALVVSNTRHLASGRTLAHLNYAVCGAALRACWEHAAELARGERGSEGGGGGGASFSPPNRQQRRPPALAPVPPPPPPPPPMPPTPEARAALWALAAVPRSGENGGGEAGAGEKMQGRAALDRLLERAGIIVNGDAPAAADWPSRL